MFAIHRATCGAHGSLDLAYLPYTHAACLVSAMRGSGLEIIRRSLGRSGACRHQIRECLSLHRSYAAGVVYENVVAAKLTAALKAQREAHHLASIESGLGMCASEDASACQA